MNSESPFAIEKGQLRNALTDFVQGKWIGDGTDVFPMPNGPPPTPTAYVETMEFGEIFEIVNPGAPPNSQTLLGIRYFTQLVSQANSAPLHQETGYWLFDVDNGNYIKAISIPRGITILAGGAYHFKLLLPPPLSFEMIMFASAENSSNVFGISNATFLNQVAPTTNFTTKIKLSGNKLFYHESSMLTIGGQSVKHTDTATLIRQ